MIDASSGGDIFNKTPFDIRALFGTISQNQRNFGPRNDLKRSSTQGVSEVATSNAHLESKILDLTNVVSQLVVGNGQQLMVCGVCAMTGHHTDMCPMIVGEHVDVNAMGGYQSQPRPSGFQNSYNSSWKQNPNYPPKQLPQNALTRPLQPQQQNSYPQHSQPQHPLNQNYQHPHQNQF
ncbi:hypothetical protein LXL04_021505 [Taraxacum kok-saghyz]